MRVLAVDDEQAALNNLLKSLQKMPEFTDITGFNSPEEALSWLAQNAVDAAFFDIDMWPVNGLALAKKTKELHPSCAVVFVTAYAKYALDAFRLRVSGYVMKPVLAEDIRRELDCIVNPFPRR